MGEAQVGMPIAELAATQEHSATAGAGRIQSAKALGALFQHAAGPTDARILPYLLQGQLSPSLAAPNRGRDERGIVQALAEAANRPEDEIWRVYQQLRCGDLGSAAAQLLGAPSAASATAARGLTAQEVYDHRHMTAATSGRGASRGKVDAFADLLLEEMGAPYLAVRAHSVMSM